jgi:thioesterase domain-containing protein
MTEHELAAQICDEFPIAKAMRLEVRQWSPAQCELWFPLEANRNNVGTAFGGALYSAAVFACYALYRAILDANGLVEGRFSNLKAEIDYTAPATTDFIARAQLAADVHPFIDRMRRHGNGFLAMTAEILVGETPVARFKASFVTSPR